LDLYEHIIEFAQNNIKSYLNDEKVPLVGRNFDYVKFFRRNCFLPSVDGMKYGMLILFFYFCDEFILLMCVVGCFHSIDRQDPRGRLLSGRQDPGVVRLACAWRSVSGMSYFIMLCFKTLLICSRLMETV
jgi:hypothetical protein